MPRRSVFIAMLAAAALGGSGALAETRVRSQSIAEGARMDIAPPALSLRFASAVEITNAILIDQEGNMTHLEAAPARGAAVAIPLPPLVPHGYRLHWRAAGSDGVTTGSVGFVINGCDDPRAVP